MKKFVLTPCEIDGINLFIEENVSLPTVEAVYLLACKTKIFEEEKIDIVTVYNTSTAYNSLFAEGTTLECGRLQDSIEKYQALFNNGRLSFLSHNSSDFLPFIFSTRERIAKRELAKGIIVFDRFGNIKKKQIDAQCELGISSDVEITNINEIIPTEKILEKVLKTTIK